MLGLLALLRPIPFRLSSATFEYSDEFQLEDALEQGNPLENGLHSHQRNNDLKLVLEPSLGLGYALGCAVHIVLGIRASSCPGFQLLRAYVGNLGLKNT